MLLILDEKPSNPLQRLSVETKGLLNEGLRKWSWAKFVRKTRFATSLAKSHGFFTELRRRGISFQYNQFSERQNYDTCWVMSSPTALRWAIEQKRKGLIKTLIAGPQIYTFPSDSGELLAHPSIDAVVFASEWAQRMFSQHLKLSPNFIWAAGVDEREWLPGLGRRELTLVLDKYSGILDAVVSKLLQKNYPVEVLRYGSHTRQEYKQLLQKSRMAVILSPHEVQGVNSFEAWACDVPTIHWNPKKYKHLGHVFHEVSSVPFLTEKCGVEFSDTEDFVTALDQLEWNFRRFQPRNFVLDSHTMKHVVDRFLEIQNRTSLTYDLQELRNTNPELHASFFLDQPML